MSNSTASFWQSPWKSFLLAGLIAGTCDICGAILVFSIIEHKVSAERILQSIVSGIVGKDAYTGGMEMPVFGLLLHYFIAFSFTAFYFIIYPHVPLLRVQKIRSAILYGIFIWVVMNLVVLPIAFGRFAAFNLSSILTNVIILILALGFPITYIAYKHYSTKGVVSAS
jgi:hypothetical protein